MPGKMMADSAGTPPAEESAETVQVPMAALQGAQVGDTISFTVQSIDGDTATLYPAKESEPAEENSNMNPKPSTISQAADLFGQGGE